MEDKQIIELYWNRSDDAIKETKVKYGAICTYIANNILSDEAVVEACVNESYEILWDTIPPRKPLNLKAYLCKITRSHALEMRYSERDEHEMDLFTAELIIHDFIKGLVPEQRKVFMAYYWYFASVSEIATKYKMSENKVDEILRTLHQKIDAELELKNVHLQTEEEFLYAMTEVEDRYLEEVELLQDGNEEKREKTAHISREKWIKGGIVVAVSIVMLAIIAVVMPKHPVEQTPSENFAGSESQKEEPNTQIPEKDVDLENFITILTIGTYHKDDLAVLKENHPWKEDKVIAALPVYKNLSYDSHDGAKVYMDEDTLTSMVEEIAEKLNMNIISTKFDKKSTGDEQNKYAVCGIRVTTDTGSIQIDEKGKVMVSFMDGVRLSNGYEMSNSASIESANQVVEYLMTEYSDILPETNFYANSYPTYDAEGDRTMNYRAVVDGESIGDIMDYYFNQVEFYFNEGLGLTGFSYGDIRFATEFLGYYPIVSLEEAKILLQEGNFKTNIFDSNSKELLEYKEEDILGVELMYKVNDWERYYQPYYCFYIFVKQVDAYVDIYVPAVQGAIADEQELPQSDVKIIDMDGYDVHSNFVYYKDGTYYTIADGELKEGDRNVLLAKDTIGETSVEHTDNGTVTNFYYGDSEVLNLDEVMQGKEYDSLSAMYIDGEILIIAIKYLDGNMASPIATCYLYSKENGSLTQTIEPTPSRGNTMVEFGLTFYGGRYAIREDEDRTLLIVDALEGMSIDTGIQCDDVETIRDAGDQYFAIQYKNKEIAIVDKASGKIVRKTKFKVNFSVSEIQYKDEMIYIETWSGGNFVFVISEDDILTMMTDDGVKFKLGEWIPENGERLIT